MTTLVIENKLACTVVPSNAIAHQRQQERENLYNVHQILEQLKL